MQLAKCFFISLLSVSAFLSADESSLLSQKASSSLVIDNTSKETSGRETLLSLIAGEWIAKSIYTVAELDIASHLVDSPKTAKELALLAKCNEEHLYRVMRLLASVGVFHEDANHIFSNTKASELLSKDHPESLNNLTVFYSKEMSRSMDHLLEGVIQGKPAFTITFGEPVFSYFKGHPETAVLFNASMKEKSRAVITSCLKSYDFAKFTSVYDIGGGMGHFLGALLRSSPHMKGVLYELPGVIDQAKAPMSSFENCSLVSGDFFDSIPQGGDAYLLKSVLHDWNDMDCMKILSKCHASMNEDSKLVVIEPILKAANKPEYAKAMDVYMMAITGGKERTLEDFKRILESSGFIIETISSTETEFSIIQAKKM